MVIFEVFALTYMKICFLKYIQILIHLGNIHDTDILKKKSTLFMS